MRKVRTISIALFLLLALATIPAAAFDAPPAGPYRITGSDNDGGGSYEGSVILTHKGDAYAFEGVVDGQDYRGAGLYDKQSNVLALAFQGADQGEQGVTLLRWNGKTLKGNWTYLDNPDGDLGMEEWTPAE